MSYLMLWPSLSTAGASRGGFRGPGGGGGRYWPGRGPALRALVPGRDVARAAGLERERETHQLGAHGVERGGLGVEGDESALARPLDPGRESGLVAFDTE